MKYFFCLFFSFSSCLFSMTLKDKIKALIITGFNSQSEGEELAQMGLGGLIFYQRNVLNQEQLKAYLDNLKSINPKIFLAIDQEGGLVRRLKEEHGYTKLDSPFEMGKKDLEIVYNEYHSHFGEIKDTGFNLIFAPVLDIYNKECPSIGKLNRSFSEKPEIVYNYSSKMVKAINDNDMFCCGKHFPGHGNSKKDTHKGFTDVTDSWQEIELYPFVEHIKNGLLLIMSSHLVNRNWDDQKNPLSLSLRLSEWMHELNFTGIVVSDDLMMKALFDWLQTYEKEKVLLVDKLSTIAIKALLCGNHLLIFSSNAQKFPIPSVPQLMKGIIKQIKQKALEDSDLRQKIEEAYERVFRVFNR